MLMNVLFFKLLYFADKEVMKILTQVSVTRREAEIKLDETNFYERKLINKRKDLILEGKDPDEVEEEQEELKRKKKLKKKGGKNKHQRP
jgi:ATP-dependent RNA helicase DDX49/DBP8